MLTSINTIITTALPSCADKFMELIPWQSDQCMLCLSKCTQYFLEAVRHWETEPDKMIVAALEMSREIQ